MMRVSAFSHCNVKVARSTCHPLAAGTDMHVHHMLCCQAEAREMAIHLRWQGLYTQVKRVLVQHQFGIVLILFLW